jgi:hypothetical protein
MANCAQSDWGSSVQGSMPFSLTVFGRVEVGMLLGVVVLVAGTAEPGAASEQPVSRHTAVTASSN